MLAVKIFSKWFFKVLFFFVVVEKTFTYFVELYVE